jgi:exonuclease III
LTWICHNIYTKAKKKSKREGNTTKKRQKRKNTYNIATWNIRTTYKGKLNIVQKEINRMDKDILGISEMKWTGSGHFRSVNNKVMYLGHDTHRKNGVGMIITNQVSKSLIGYKTVNNRIMYIRVKARPVNITCVQVYAPTTSVETVDIEEFYRNLQSVLNEIPKKDVLILMGDWNSKIGKGE